MKTEDIALGELVILNSGSPPLTVREIDDDEDELTVSWLDHNSRPQEMTAPAACFKLFSEVVTTP